MSNSASFDLKVFCELFIVCCDSFFAVMPLAFLNRGHGIQFKDFPRLSAFKSLDVSDVRMAPQSEDGEKEEKVAISPVVLQVWSPPRWELSGILMSDGSMFTLLEGSLDVWVFIVLGCIVEGGVDTCKRVGVDELVASDCSGCVEEHSAHMQG